MLLLERRGEFVSNARVGGAIWAILLNILSRPQPNVFLAIRGPLKRYTVLLEEYDELPHVSGAVVEAKTPLKGGQAVTLLDGLSPKLQ
jgi:hypothetical protein